MLDGLTLLLQLRERIGSNCLGFVRQRLASLEPLRAAVQPLRPYDLVSFKLLFSFKGTDR